MTHYTVDCSSVRNRDELHTLLELSLPLPEYYGRNLDALFDWLTELGETELEFTGTEAMNAALGSYADAFLGTLFDAAEENDCLRVSVHP